MSAPVELIDAAVTGGWALTNITVVPTAPFSYSFVAPAGTPVTHLVIGLPPNLVYTLTGAVQPTAISSPLGVLQFSTTGTAGLQTVTLSVGVPPVPPAPPKSIQVLDGTGKVLQTYPLA